MKSQFWFRINNTLIIAAMFTAQLSSVVSAADPLPTILTVPHCSISLIDQVTLAAARPGVIGQVLCVEGDFIAAGTLVAQLDNSEAAATNQLSQFAANSDIAIRLAEKTREVADVELQQAKELNARQNVYTEFEMRRLKLTLDQTLLECEQARHDQQLKTLEQAVAAAQLAAHDVTSTFAGTVVHVFKQPGEAVQQGEPVLEIVNAERLRVEGFVPVAQVGSLKIGQSVHALLPSSDAKPPLRLPGVLKFIDVSVQPVTQEVRIWAEINNAKNQVKPGQPAQLEIALK